MWKNDGNLPRHDIRDQRIAHGTIGGEHAVPSSMGRLAVSNFVTVFDPNVTTVEAGGSDWGFYQSVATPDALGYPASHHVAGASISFSFSGPKVAIYGMKYSGAGKVDITVDGASTVGRLDFSTPLDPAWASSGNNNRQIDNSTTTIHVLNTSSFANSGTLYIDQEQITYSGKTSQTFTGCTRGANGTTAAYHNATTPVYQASSIVDLYSARVQSKKAIWSKTDLAPGNHIVTATIRSDQNASSSGSFVIINGFSAGNMLGATNISTNIIYDEQTGLTSDSHGVVGPLSVLANMDDQQIISVLGAYPTAGGANTCYVMWGLSDLGYFLVFDKTSTNNLAASVAFVTIGPSI